jgi:hypothetical protein
MFGPGLRHYIKVFYTPLLKHRVRPRFLVVSRGPFMVQFNLTFLTSRIGRSFGSSVCDIANGVIRLMIENVLGRNPVCSAINQANGEAVDAVTRFNGMFWRASTGDDNLKTRSLGTTGRNRSIFLWT